MKTCKTVNGVPVEIPVVSSDEAIFKGWNKELFSVEQDVEVYPMWESIGTEKNIVYADTVYAATDTEIQITPKLAGTVDCCEFLIEIAYDNQLLHFEGAQQLIDGLRVDNDDQRGVITLTYCADTRLDRALELVHLVFRCESEGGYHTTLPMQTSKILTIKDGTKVYTDSTAHIAHLYLLK